MLPLNLSDTALTSQDGSSLEFIAAIAVRQCYIQDASGRGMCTDSGTVNTTAPNDPKIFLKNLPYGYNFGKLIKYIYSLYMSSIFVLFTMFTTF